MLDPVELVAQAKAKGFTFAQGRMTISPTCGCAIGVACLLKGVNLYDIGVTAYEVFAKAAEVLGMPRGDVIEVSCGFDDIASRGEAYDIGVKIRQLVDKEGLWAT